MGRFYELYDFIFVRNKHKNVCEKYYQELILLADQADNTIKHGDPYTKKMDVNAIHNLKKKLDEISYVFCQ